jgi:hypothetical protein
MGRFSPNDSKSSSQTRGRPRASPSDCSPILESPLALADPSAPLGGGRAHNRRELVRASLRPLFDRNRGTDTKREFRRLLRRARTNAAASSIPIASACDSACGKGKGTAPIPLRRTNPCELRRTATRRATTDRAHVHRLRDKGRTKRCRPIRPARIRSWARPASQRRRHRSVGRSAHAETLTDNANLVVCLTQTRRTRRRYLAVYDVADWKKPKSRRLPHSIPQVRRDIGRTPRCSRWLPETVLTRPAHAASSGLWPPLLKGVARPASFLAASDWPSIWSAACDRRCSQR